MSIPYLDKISGFCKGVQALFGGGTLVVNTMTLSLYNFLKKT